MAERKGAVKPLGKRERHQKIADVDDELGQDHLKDGPRPQDDPKAGHLPGGGKVGQRNEDSRKRGKPAPHRRNAKAEGDREIAKRDGDAVNKSLPERALCCMFHGKPHRMTAASIIRSGIVAIDKRVEMTTERLV